MAESLLHDNPELRPFILSNVMLTGTKIGAGAYGSVEEVTVPVGAAAKKIHDIFQDRSEIPEDEILKASTNFVKECQLMSTLRHPNIVQFLGVCFVQGARLPALVMERLLTNLHDLLVPETKPSSSASNALSFFKLDLKCSVLHDVASGLSYLHQQTPPIIHRDLSARNILLNTRLVAKIADLGVARIVPCMTSMATMTKAPGASVYMPPEAIAPSGSNTEKSKYDASIDIFSLGVVTIFTIGEIFPCDPLAHNYLDDKSGLLVARTELQRRSEYMRNVNTQLRAYGQLRGDYPLILLIQQCLHNGPHKRPNIHEVLRLLEEAKVDVWNEQSEKNKHRLVQALENHPINQVSTNIYGLNILPGILLVWMIIISLCPFQNVEHILQDLVTCNARLQHQLESNTLQLKKKDTELCRAEESIRRGEQLVQAKDRELTQVQQQLKSSEALVAELQKTLQLGDSELEILRLKVSKMHDLAEPPLWWTQ